MAKIIREKRGSTIEVGGKEQEYLYRINMYHEKMFDEKVTRASSPDVLFNIGARHSSYARLSARPPLGVCFS